MAAAESEGSEESGNVVGVVARFAIQADRVDEFKELALREMVAPTRQEEGCLRYELWQDREDPTRFAMVEEWTSEEALSAHLAQPGLQAAVQKLLPMGSEAVQMTRFRPLCP